MWRWVCADAGSSGCVPKNGSTGLVVRSQCLEVCRSVEDRGDLGLDQDAFVEKHIDADEG